MKHRSCSLEDSLHIWKPFWTKFSQLCSAKLLPYMQPVQPSRFRPVVAELCTWSFRTSLLSQERCHTTASTPPLPWRSQQCQPSSTSQGTRKATTDRCPQRRSQALAPPSPLLTFWIVLSSPAHTQNTAPQQHLQSQTPLSDVHSIFISFPPQAGEHCASLHALTMHFLLLCAPFPHPHHRTRHHPYWLHHQKLGWAVFSCKHYQFSNDLEEGASPRDKFLH